jgi:hypothetical protein
MSLISRVLGGWLKKSRPTTRLDEAEAVRIARQAAAGYPDRDLLSMVTLSEESGRITWQVGAAAVGSRLVVTIDDETGQVVEIKRYGIR